MMQAKVILTFIIAIVVSVATAQEFVSMKDESAIRKKLQETSVNFNTLQCDFIQEKNTSLLTAPAKSIGVFSYKKENKVRLEYKTPSTNIMILNSGKMMMNDGKKTIQIEAGRNRFFQQFNSIITGSVNGNLFSSKDFQFKTSESKTQIKIELTPTSKSLKNYLSKIIMVLEKKNYTADRLEMHEPNGDNTILTFNNKKINAPLTDNLFSLK